MAELDWKDETRLSGMSPDVEMRAVAISYATRILAGYTASPEVVIEAAKAIHDWIRDGKEARS